MKREENMPQTSTSSSDKSARRKRLRVDRQVQGAIARRITFQWFVFLVVAALVLPLFHVMLRGDFTKPLAATLYDVGVDFLILLVTFLCLLPYFMLDTYKLTNRFAGPIYRLRNTIRSLVRGEQVAPLKFRQGDFWHDLAEEFNSLQGLKNATAEPSADSPAKSNNVQTAHHTTGASA